MFFSGVLVGMFLLAALLVIGYFIWDTYEKLNGYENRFRSIDEQVRFFAREIAALKENKEPKT
jgi:hypothetical protein